MNNQNSEQSTLSAPAVSLVLLKAGGHQMQRIPGRKGRFDFQYALGIGHVRTYHSIEQFHREELEIRSIPQSCAILTRIGILDAMENARSALDRLITDITGHAPTKRQRLIELREIIDAEVARLESRGVGIEQPAEEMPPSDPIPTPEQHDADRRRAELRRMGEQHTRSVVRELGLNIPLLNNYAGMIEAVVEHELYRDRKPEAEDRREALLGVDAEAGRMPPPLSETGNRKEEPVREFLENARARLGEELKEDSTAAVESDPFKNYSEDELLRMPFKELKALAARRGIEKGTRKTITEEMIAQA